MNQVMDDGMGGRGGGDELVTCGLVAVNSSVNNINDNMTCSLHPKPYSTSFGPFGNTRVAHSTHRPASQPASLFFQFQPNIILPALDS